MSYIQTWVISISIFELRIIFEIIKKLTPVTQGHYCWPLVLADLRGARMHAFSGSKFFQLHAVFGKIWQNSMSPPQGWRPHLGEILDPPLFVYHLLALGWMIIWDFKFERTEDHFTMTTHASQQVKFFLIFVNFLTSNKTSELLCTVCIASKSMRGFWNLV